MDLSLDSKINDFQLMSSILKKEYLYPFLAELSSNNISWYVVIREKTAIKSAFTMMTLEFQGTIVSDIDFNIASITLTHGKNKFSFNKESDKLIDFLLKIGLLSVHQDKKSVS